LQGRTTLAAGELNTNDLEAEIGDGRGDQLLDFGGLAFAGQREGLGRCRQLAPDIAFARGLRVQTLCRSVQLELDQQKWRAVGPPCFLWRNGPSYRQALWLSLELSANAGEFQGHSARGTRQKLK